MRSYYASSIGLAVWAAAVVPSAALGADPHACDLIEEKVAAEVLGSPISDKPARRVFTPAPDFTGTLCDYISTAGGRMQRLEIQFQIFKSTAAAKTDLDPEFKPDPDKSTQTSKESGVGDQAFYRYFVKEDKGMLVFRKGNRIVTLQAVGSGFRMTPAYKGALRAAAIRAAGKL